MDCHAVCGPTGRMRSARAWHHATDLVQCGAWKRIWWGVATWFSIMVCSRLGGQAHRHSFAPGLVQSNGHGSPCLLIVVPSLEYAQRTRTADGRMTTPHSPYIPVCPGHTSDDGKRSRYLEHIENSPCPTGHGSHGRLGCSSPSNVRISTPAVVKSSVGRPPSKRAFSASMGLDEPKGSLHGGGNGGRGVGGGGGGGIGGGGGCGGNGKNGGGFGHSNCSSVRAQCRCA